MELPENRSRSTGFSTVCANLHAVLKSSLQVPQHDASTPQDSSTSPPTQHHPAQCTIQPTTLKDPDHIQTNPKTVKISTVFTIHPKPVRSSVEASSLYFSLNSCCSFQPKHLLETQLQQHQNKHATCKSILAVMIQDCNIWQQHLSCVKAPQYFRESAALPALASDLHAASLMTRRTRSKAAAMDAMDMTQKDCNL